MVHWASHHKFANTDLPLGNISFEVFLPSQNHFQACDGNTVEMLMWHFVSRCINLVCSYFTYLPSWNLLFIISRQFPSPVKISCLCVLQLLVTLGGWCSVNWKINHVCACRDGYTCTKASPCKRYTCICLPRGDLC